MAKHNKKSKICAAKSEESSSFNGEDVEEMLDDCRSFGCKSLTASE